MDQWKLTIYLAALTLPALINAEPTELNTTSLICTYNNNLPFCYQVIKSQKPLTWQTAINSCQETQNKTPTNVQEVDIEQLLDEFLSVHSPGVAAEEWIWTQGFYVHNASWVDVKGNLFTETAVSGSDQYANCAVYSYAYNAVFARRCTTPDRLRRSLCQFSLSTGSCPASAKTLSGSCYVIPDSRSGSWEHARDSCRAYHPAAHLADSHLLADDMKDYITSRLTQPVSYSLNTEMWLGVRRHHWYWRDSDSPDDEPQSFPLTFLDQVTMSTNTSSSGLGSGDVGTLAQHIGTSPGVCLTILIQNTSAEWRGLPCNYSLQSYICPTYKNTQAEVSTEAHMTTDLSSDWTTEIVTMTTAAMEDTGLKSEYVIIIICVSVVFAVLMLIILILAKKLHRANKIHSFLPTISMMMDPNSLYPDYNQNTEEHWHQELSPAWSQSGNAPYDSLPPPTHSPPPPPNQRPPPQIQQCQATQSQQTSQSRPLPTVHSQQPTQPRPLPNPPIESSNARTPLQRSGTSPDRPPSPTNPPPGFTHENFISHPQPQTRLPTPPEYHSNPSTYRTAPPPLEDYEAMLKTRAARYPRTSNYSRFGDSSTGGSTASDEEYQNSELFSSC